MQSTSAKILHVDAPNEYNSGSDSDTDTDNDTISPCYLLISSCYIPSLPKLYLVVCVHLPMLLLFMNLRRNRDLHTSSVKLSSDTCDWQGSFCTSKKLKSTKGRPPFEVNVRTVVAFREICKGHTAIKKYCGFMNMPKSINDSAYAGIVSRLNVAYKDIANVSMSIAAEDIHNENIDTISDDTVDIDISADGA